MGEERLRARRALTTRRRTREPPLVQKFSQQSVSLFSSMRFILFWWACTIVFRRIFVGTKLLKETQRKSPGYRR